MTAVPAQYQAAVDNAAAQLGIPSSIVAAQINLESGWNPNATSPTGAQGLTQFEPGTWATYGVGNPYDPQASMNAYVKFMKVLLGQFGGNISNALAAYNAGPGNIGAGQGYADQILAAAGSGVTTSAGTGTGSPTTGTTPASSDTASPTCLIPVHLGVPIGPYTQSFDYCIISKNQGRALLGGLLIGGGGFLFLFGVASVLKYGMDTSGTTAAVSGSVLTMAKFAK